MRARRCSLLIALALGAQLAHAQQNLPRPSVLAIFPAGAKAGDTVEVVVTEQSELEEADGLIFSHPGISAKPVMTEPDRFYPQPRPVPNTFKVVVAGNVPPGAYEVRAVVGSAISNARRFVVSDLPEVVETEPNDAADQANEISIGSVVNGRYGRDYDYFRFSAKAGQRAVVHCQSQRIDSRGDPVLSISNAAGRELARSHDAVGSDAMLDFQAPADGDYILRVHELTFTSSGEAGTAPYRVTVADRPWVDFVDPPIGQRGQAASVTLLGSNLGGSPSDVVFEGRRLEKLTVNVPLPGGPSASPDGRRCAQSLAEGALDWFYYQHATGKGRSNPVAIALAEGPLSREAEPNDQLERAQELKLPADVVARFDRPGDVDGYVFDARRGETLAIEVQSQQLGQLADPVLVVQRLVPQADGKVVPQDLNATDDVNIQNMNFRLSVFSADPAWRLQAPEDGRYRVLVRDQFDASASGRPTFYRLKIGPPRADFHLVAVPDLELSPDNNNNQQLQPRAVVRRGGAVEVLVFAHRSGGFQGDIELRVDGLPGGVAADPAVIGPDMFWGAVVIRAEQNAGAWKGPIRITGRAKVENRDVAHTAAAAEMLWQMNNNDPSPSRLASTVFLAVDDQLTLPARVEASQTDLRMARGGKLTIPLKLAKQTDWKGNIPVAVVGLPPGINKNTTNVSESGNEGKIELDIQQNAAPGRYTVFLRGDAEIDYRRRADLADRALADRDRINQVKQELEKEYQTAVGQRQTAERTQQQAVQTQNTATNEKNQADQTAQQTQQQRQQTAKQAADAQTAAQEAAKRKTEGEAKLKAATDDNGRNQAQTELNALTQAAQSAQTAFENADRQAKEAATAAAQAATKLEEAQKKLTAAAEAAVKAEEEKRLATEKENQARVDRDQGEQKRQRAEQILQQANNTAQQRKIKTPAHSRQLTLTIVSFPVRPRLNSDKLQVVAGAQTEMTLSVQREFDFQGEVNAFIQPPSGVGGWSLSQNAKAEANQNEGKFTLNIDRNSPPGEYQAELLLRVNFNNRQLDERLPIQVVVKPAPAQ